MNLLQLLSTHQGRTISLHYHHVQFDTPRLVFHIRINRPNNIKLLSYVRTKLRISRLNWWSRLLWPGQIVSSLAHNREHSSSIYLHAYWSALYLQFNRPQVVTCSCDEDNASDTRVFHRMIVLTPQRPYSLVYPTTFVTICRYSTEVVI